MDDKVRPGKPGADADDGPKLHHTADGDKKKIAVESKKVSKNLDESHSVIDEDCEGEVTVRYSA